MTGLDYSTFIVLAVLIAAGASACAEDVTTVAWNATGMTRLEGFTCAWGR